MTVRRLSPADAALYRALRLEGLEQNPEAFASTHGFEGAQDLAWFEERLGQSVVFGAFRDEALVGIAGYRVQPGAKMAHKGTLWGMYVSPSARGTGTGRRLVEAVIVHAREHIELLQLSVVSDNAAARRLYESFGFVTYGLEKHAVKHDGRYADDFLMALMLRDG